MIAHSTHEMIIDESIYLCKNCRIDIADPRIEIKCSAVLNTPVSRNNYYNSGSYPVGTGSDLE